MNLNLNVVNEKYRQTLTAEESEAKRSLEYFQRIANDILLLGGQEKAKKAKPVLERIEEESEYMEEALSPSRKEAPEEELPQSPIEPVEDEEIMITEDVQGDSVEEMQSHEEEMQSPLEKVEEMQSPMEEVEEEQIPLEIEETRDIQDAPPQSPLKTSLMEEKSDSFFDEPEYYPSLLK